MFSAIVIPLIVFAETFAMYCIKKFQIGDGIHFFVAAVAMYALVCYLFNYCLYMKYSMGAVNVICSGLTVLSVALVGVLFFKEKIRFYDIVAGSLITVGMLIFKYTE